jgi:hypothetical protein
LQQCTDVERGREDKSVNGVHGIWTLHGLSYANNIFATKDSMHSANNTIKDSLCVLKPNTTVPSKFENRTTRPNVVASCREFHIFPFVYADTPRFPWILTSEDIKIHDDRFKHVLGAFSIEIPKKILRFGKARNSHDTIQYAINGWAAWGHYNIDILANRKDSDKYVNSKLRLFNCIGTLFAGKQKTVFYLNFTIFHHELTVIH